MTNLKLGDYIIFGSYLGESILWQIINFDSDGDPLLFSYNVLSIKAFDSNGDKHIDESRKKSGSNNWEYSNLRQWLNSKDDTIDWIQNRPSAENLDLNFLDRQQTGGYEDEKGFLSPDNFTINESKLIKECTRKVVLPEIDTTDNDGKLENIEPRALPSIKLADLIKERYYKEIKDKVFLLSIKELKDYLVDKGLYNDKRPTAECIDKKFLREQDIYHINKYIQYWTSTPIVSSPNKIYSALSVYRSMEAYNCFVGVAPAMYIKFDSSKKTLGDGTFENAYILEDDSITNKFRENRTQEKEIFRKEILEREKLKSEKNKEFYRDMFNDGIKQVDKYIEFQNMNKKNTTNISENTKRCFKNLFELAYYISIEDIHMLKYKIDEFCEDFFIDINNYKNEIDFVSNVIGHEKTEYARILNNLYDSVIENNFSGYLVQINLLKSKIRILQRLFFNDIEKAKEILLSLEEKDKEYQINLKSMKFKNRNVDSELYLNECQNTCYPIGGMITSKNELGKVKKSIYDNENGLDVELLEANYSSAILNNSLRKLIYEIDNYINSRKGSKEDYIIWDYLITSLLADYYISGSKWNKKLSKDLLKCFCGLSQDMTIRYNISVIKYNMIVQSFISKTLGRLNSFIHDSNPQNKRIDNESLENISNFLINLYQFSPFSEILDFIEGKILYHLNDNLNIKEKVVRLWEERYGSERLIKIEKNYFAKPEVIDFGIRYLDNELGHLIIWIDVGLVTNKKAIGHISFYDNNDVLIKMDDPDIFKIIYDFGAGEGICGFEMTFLNMFNIKNIYVEILDREGKKINNSKSSKIEESSNTTKIDQLSIKMEKLEEQYTILNQNKYKIFGEGKEKKKNAKIEIARLRNEIKALKRSMKE
jgi:hypothetical protein